MGKYLESLIILLLFLLVVYFAIFVRSKTIDTDIPLDYDPWWFYRYAKYIIKNFYQGKGFLIGKWDSLSYWPPGRPVFGNGWSYTIAFFYILVRNFIDITLEKFCVYFILVFVAFTAVPIFLVGRTITNNYGGLATAFFMLLSPTFITVSLAGYIDSDVVYVFYTYLCILATLLAIKKWKKIDFSSARNFFLSILRISHYLFFAILSYWLFSFNWLASWYILYIFLVFSFIYFFLELNGLKKFVIKLINFFNGECKFSDFMNEVKKLMITDFKEQTSILTILLLIFLFGNVTTYITRGYPFGTQTPIEQLINGLKFVQKKGLIVNKSVAELQFLNPFSKKGFEQISSRVGIVASVLAIFGLPFLLFYNLIYLKRRPTLIETFLIVWMAISLWLISGGVRFSLLFYIIKKLIKSTNNRSAIF